jgi:mannosyltransferase
MSVNAAQPIKRLNGKSLSLENNLPLQITLLIGVTLFGAILRFIKLADWSLWVDEIVTMMNARSVFQGVLSDPSVILRVLFRESLSDVLIYIPLKLFGMTELNARMMPALIGILSIPLLFFAIKKLTDAATAMLVVSLLSISPWHIEWSQNARFYMPLLVLYTLAILAFFFGIEKDKSWYLGLSLFLLYLATRERLFALFYLPVVIGYFLVLQLLRFEKPAGFRVRNILLVTIVPLVLGLFFGGRFVAEPSDWVSDFSYVTADPLFIFSLFVHYVGIPIICLGVVGALYLVFKKDRLGLFLALAALVPLLAVMVISPFQFTSTRYTFITLPAWLMLASFTALTFLSQAQGKAKILAVGGILVILASPIFSDYLYFRYENGYRANWKAAFELVERRKAPEDLVVTPAISLGIFYLGPQQGKQVYDMFKIDQNFIATSDQRVWIVNNRRKIEPSLQNWVEQNCELIEVFDVQVGVETKEMRVYLFDPQRLLQ